MSYTTRQLILSSPSTYILSAEGLSSYIRLFLVILAMLPASSFHIQFEFYFIFLILSVLAFRILLINQFFKPPLSLRHIRKPKNPLRPTPQCPKTLEGCSAYFFNLEKYRHKNYMERWIKWWIPAGFCLLSLKLTVTLLLNCSRTIVTTIRLAW